MENQIERFVFNEKDYNNVWNNLATFNIRKNEKAYIFIDEIQLAPDVISPLKYLYDHYQLRSILMNTMLFQKNIQIWIM